MLRKFASFVAPALLLLACVQEEPPTAPVSDRELGVLEAIYPYYTKDGGWLLEYRLTLDTVFVDFGAAREMARDSAWKEALTHKAEVFYDDGGCMYTRTVTGCLPFLESPEGAPGSKP